MSDDERRRSVTILREDVDEGDEVVLTADGSEYTGVVSYKHYEEAEYHDGVPVPGRLSLDVELSNESVEEHDAPSHHLTARARESRPGYWYPAEAAVWHPDGDDVDGGWYTELGEIARVETESGDA